MGNGCSKVQRAALTAIALTTGTPAAAEAAFTTSITDAAGANTRLTVTGDGSADFIDVVCSGGNVLVGGGTPTGGPLACSALDELLIDGGGGADNINAFTNATNFSGLDDEVTLSGAAGTDTVEGTHRADQILGGLDNDSLLGSTGDDSISGNAGADTIRGELGDDVLDGGSEADVLRETFGGDGESWGTTTSGTMAGTRGNDSFSNFESIFVTGGSGSDVMNMRHAAVPSTLEGGAGIDTLGPSTGASSLIGGTESDSVLFLSNSSPITISDTSIGRSPEGLISMSGIESVRAIGGPAAQLMSASKASISIRLEGDDGNDTLVGGTGTDDLSGGLGVDSMVGGGGTDRAGEANVSPIVAGPGQYTAAGEANTVAADVESFFFSGIQNADLSAASIKGFVTGTGGDDIVVGSPFADTANLFGGTDTFEQSGTDLTLAGASVISPPFTDFTTQVERFILTGTAGGDLLEASKNSAAVTLRGLGGADTLSGFAGGGTVLMEGGAGDDRLAPANGAVTADGGPDIDLLDLKAFGNAALGASSYDDGGSTFSHAAIETALIENLSGGGDPVSNISAAGYLGDATILGGAGIDVLTGGQGDDLLDGRDGVDAVRETGTGFTAAGAVLKSFGQDTLTSISQVDLYGTAGNDTFDLTSLSLPLRIFAGDGGDSMTGGAAADTLVGQGGTDTVVATDVASATLGTSSITTPTGGTDNHDAEAGALTGTTGADLLDASAFPGATTITGLLGADTLNGGTGPDDVRARDGVADQIACAGGTDTLEADTSDVQTGCESVLLPPVPGPTLPGGAAPPPPPVVVADTTKPTLKVVSAKLDAKGRVVARLRCANEACSGALSATGKQGKKTITIGRKNFALPAGRAVAVTLTLKRAKLRLVTKRGKAGLTLRATAKDRAGNSATSVRRLSVKLKRR